ncbi:ABC transporter permease [Amycolatopsis rhabdoformis]|uniref:ABC transporter permease n=1 Tax=Amycolatopsis rhabdoformis TaxID=1448059 RepID=A0ABZ1ICD0_9PSEU|nr:ABC transporter permease [Amycolatopsis rhabdoformis]WSE32090.1 ABC transporter permease [Amycolatopsis rhabdoformis]
MATGRVERSPQVTEGAAEQDERDRRADRRRKWVVRGGQLAVGVLVLVLWQIAGQVFGAFTLSGPVLIVVRIGELIGSGTLWPDLATTLVETFAGLVIGMVAGVALGVLIASSKVVGRWFYPYVMALYSLPRVALAPLFIVWFGIGLESKIFMVVTMVVFVAFYNTYQGVRGIDPDLLEMTRSFRAPRMATLRWAVLPAIAPWILTSLRLSIALALIGAVIAELVGASQGLGYYMGYAANTLDTTGVFAGLVVITVIAVIAEQLVALVERRVLRHRVAH